MDPIHLTRTTSRPATDHPINHTPRPSLPPMTKDPFLLQTIPSPPSPTKSRMADIFVRRRQASRQQQQQQQQTYPHPPTSMPAALSTDPAAVEMQPLHGGGIHDRAKKTDSTSTSMGTPQSPHPPGAAPLPAPAHLHPTTNNNGYGRRSAPEAGRNNNKQAGYRGSLLEGVRYSAGGEPVGWFEMFEKTRKFEGGFVETKEGGVRCIHPCAWGEDELGEYGPGGGGGGGKGRGGSGVGIPAVEVVGAARAGDASGSQGGGSINRADSETLGQGRYGESVAVVHKSERVEELRSGLIGLQDGDEADNEGEGTSRLGSNAMEMMFILDEGPPPGVVVGGPSRLR